METFSLFQSALEKSDAFLHIIIVGTKPDIIKQVPLYQEFKRRGWNVIVGHTGQHYDYNLSQSLFDEFGIELGFNLGINGSHAEKVGQIWIGIESIIKSCEAHKKTPIFYVHGDTMTASTVASASFAHRYPVVHIEAGIRTLSLNPTILRELLDKGITDWEAFKRLSLDPSNYTSGSIEPYPEQFNTRSVATTAGLHFTPDELAYTNLKNEGYPEDIMHTPGNTIADITREALAHTHESTIFEQYPMLQDGFIRFCIHRHENCVSQERFLAVFEAMEQLAEKGYPILLIMMNKTNSAIEQFGLTQRLENLKAKKNVLITDVWPKYMDVIAAMQKAIACVTDSGSMQEEMHLMNIPCVTLRYGTDRPETLFAGSNVLAPPHDANLITQIVERVIADRATFTNPNKNCYGENVSSKIADQVEKHLNEYGTLVRDERHLIVRLLRP